MKKCCFLKAGLAGILLFSFSGFMGAEEQAAPSKADIVVVGGGASGLSAALTAAEAGAQVVVLEKLAYAGGTLNFSEGIMAAESSLQQKKGITATKHDIYKTIMEYSHYKANPLLVSAVVNETPQTVNWLLGEGVEFKDVVAFGPGFPATWHLWKDSKGSNTVKVLVAKLKALNVPMLMETSGQDLIMDNGKVAGIIAKTSKGDVIRIAAKAVIIGTGGFANNTEMLKKYTEFPKAVAIGNIAKTGDGIQMAWKAGAADHGTNVVQAFCPVIEKDNSISSHLYKMTRQPNIVLINTQGQRFFDESVSLNWAYEALALGEQGGEAFAVVDQSLIKRFIDQGVPGNAKDPEPVKLTNLEDNIAKDMAKGSVYKADTIEALAAAAGINPTVLKATIADYNKACASGVDTTCFKPATYLNSPIATPPFYAVKIVSSSIGTLGGVKINERAEALNNSGVSIPGLYVAGNDAGGMYGDAYDLLASGGTVGFAMNSGRIAARNAVVYALK